MTRPWSPKVASSVPSGSKRASRNWFSWFTVPIATMRPSARTETSSPNSPEGLPLRAKPFWPKAASGFPPAASAVPATTKVQTASAAAVLTHTPRIRGNVSTVMSSVGLWKPGADRRGDRVAVLLQAVVALDDRDVAVRAGGRHSEAVALALDDQGRDLDGVELG